MTGSNNNADKKKKMIDKDSRIEIEKIEESIRQLEKMKADGIMPAELAEASIDGLKIRLNGYYANLQGDGALAQGRDSRSVGKNGILVDGDVTGNLLIGAKIEKLEVLVQSYKNKSLPFPEALDHYLDNIIATYQKLRLQGIRAGSQPLSVSLEKIYVSLTALDKRASSSNAETYNSGATLTMSAALKRYKRLVIIGDPGSGKTTLLAYLTLTYARSLRGEGVEVRTDTQNKDGSSNIVSSIIPLLANRLSIDEADHLPILVSLRDLGHQLDQKYSNPGKDGPAILLDYLYEYYCEQNIVLPDNFFNAYLDKGHAVIMLDGMDEVAKSNNRQRVARLIEKFSERYSNCRFIVTSREVGYEGASRIGAGFGLAKVREFTPQEVRQFVRDWTRAVETTLSGSDGPDSLNIAERQADHLVKSIENNPRVADLAVNPLLLTVVALVHRYRAQLPERRSELYEEAVEVLLGHWDAAKGMETEFLLPGGRILDSGDRRSLLEPVAFWMHEHRKRELERDDLRTILLPKFTNMMSGDNENAIKALDAFLHLINERSGLLIERGVGVYGFAHLTFQEYLTARVLAERDDSLKYSLNVLSDAWWREVLLLEAGYLSSQGTRRVSALIQTFLEADIKTEPEPFHHLILAAECMFDVGAARVDGDLLGEIRKRLQKQANAPFSKSDKATIYAKITASNALAHIEKKQIVSRFWKQPYGEPEWTTIQEGEFWTTTNGLARKVLLPEYKIARVPVTNSQYALFIQDQKNSIVSIPEHWRGGNVPSGLENHPVVNVCWSDAVAYCEWLGEKIQKPISLPSELQWEKAARGNFDKRDYPWGSEWRELHCNSGELGLGYTIPVGLFINGASPFGVLDMSGNVWEWTSGADIDSMGEVSLTNEKILRGGSYLSMAKDVRCEFCGWYYLDGRYGFVGFRIASS